jgi:rare lipoprotein A
MLASGDAQSPASDAGATVNPPARAKRGTRAGETLTEAQLLERYEGKRAVETLTGKATYYANSLAGRKTASGEPYLPSVFSAAHRTLPFGTVVRVVRTDTNKYVYVRITDRGPFAGGGRIIDLSYVAAQRLGMIRAGVVPVRVEVLR